MLDTNSVLFLYLPWLFFTIVMVVYIIDSLREHKKKHSIGSQEYTIIRGLEERDKAFNATTALNGIILDTLDFNLAAQKIANAIPQILGYETGVLALVDQSKGVLRRIAISETPGGIAALDALEVPFSKIEISLSEKDNYCIKALSENRILHTTHLFDVLRPVISEANAEIVQNKMGTKTTLIFPIYSRDNQPFGTFLVSMHKSYDEIMEYEHQTLRNFVDGVRIVLRNATLYTSATEATKNLQDANERLKELDKLKNEFVSVASHELRTPMTAIKSYLWMALEGQGGPLNEKQKYYLDRAYMSVDRLIKMVNDMLNISRIESGRLAIEIKSVDLKQLTQEVIDEVTPRAKELGLTVSMEHSEDLPLVLADPDKIKEVLLNLIGNSLKFTPKDGKITVSFLHKGEFIETTVTDTGAGIESDDLPKLFQKFGLLPGSYTANQAALGTGLGLYICKSIIELHEGKIAARSEGKGKGATFVFSLKAFNENDFKRISDKFAAQATQKLGIIHTQV